MPAVFSVKEWSGVDAGRVSRVLVGIGDPIRAETVRTAYREYAIHDEDGVEIGTARTAATQTLDGGDVRPRLLTIREVERVSVFADREIEGHPRVLRAADAKACGYRTVGALRDAWKAKHPRSPLAQLVRFEVGDVRDHPRFLTSTRSMRWGPGKNTWRTRPGKPTGKLSEAAKQRAIRTAGLGDYTSSPARAIDALEVIDAANEARLATVNGQKDLARQRQTATVLASETLEQRVARLEAATAEMRAEIREELRIITERADRGRRKLNAA